jgi:asparagine synthase (glutamine-hydrolysing)
MLISSPHKIISDLIRFPKWFFFAKQHSFPSTVIMKVKEKNLTYLDRQALIELAKIALVNEQREVDGTIIEAGCALGGSAIVLASSKARERPFYIYDVFGMIPPPSIRDGQDIHRRYRVIESGNSSGIGGECYYGYEEDLYLKVQQNFNEFRLETNTYNIKLIKGLYEDSLRVNFPVSLAHIDCDWYDSVMVCLNRIEPHLVLGGTLVIDDYFCYSGCKRAVDDYFSNQDKSKYQFEKKSRLHIIKTGLPT